MEGDQRGSSGRSSIGFAADDSREHRAKYTGDHLFLQNSYHPGITLVTSILIGNNYLSWSPSIKITLEAR